MTLLPKKSIVIGCNGYLGRHLSYHLEKAGFDNQNCDIQPETHKEIKNYQQIDITKPDDLEKLNFNVSYVFMFAGLTGTANGFEDYKKFVEVNETGLLNVLTQIRQRNHHPRIIYPSTRLVYKGAKNHLLKEDDPKEARTIYAANKLNAENLLWMYQNMFGINYTVFRICVPYGNLFGGGFSYGTIGFFMSQATKGNDITLYGDGEIRRTFTHVSDISEIIINTIKKPETANEIFNIGGENLSLAEAAGLVAKKYGVNISNSQWPHEAYKLESQDTVFDDAKLRSIYPVKYQHKLGEWVEGDL
jgi:UDP-glucose 4-epimerase